MIAFIVCILVIVGNWKIYKKMGRQGWESIVPIYNEYVLCDVLYGNGWKFLLILIPIYNIYFVIKLYRPGQGLQSGRGLCHRPAAPALCVHADPGLRHGPV